MNVVLHKAETRGEANHGWLNSYHTFSFADYHNPERMRFGLLRVLNDDTVAPGMGFGTHPHDNMEIISIPLKGDLEHKDSMGNISIIRNGEVQLMSAGSGLTHSEYNKNKDAAVKFLQIWVFPDKRNVEPRYDQIKLDTAKMTNRFMQILSPFPNDEGVWIHQQAWFYLGNFTQDISTSYTLKDPTHGLYIFMIEGEATAEGHQLNKRDGLGIWETDQVQLDISKNTKILLMEVPMR